MPITVDDFRQQYLSTYLHYKGKLYHCRDTTPDGIALREGSKPYIYVPMAVLEGDLNEFDFSLPKNRVFDHDNSSIILNKKRERQFVKALSQAWWSAWLIGVGNVDFNYKMAHSAFNFVPKYKNIRSTAQLMTEGYYARCIGEEFILSYDMGRRKFWLINRSVPVGYF